MQFTFRASKLELQRKLYHTGSFTRLHNRLRRRLRDGRAARGGKHTRADTRRSGRSVARVIKIRVVESIEHLGAKLDFQSLVDRKRLDKTKIDVPVTRRDEDVGRINDSVTNNARRIQVSGKLSF